MGDFNDDPGSSMYQILTGAGFTDTWATLQAGEVGYSCCHVADLSDAVASFTQRIDYVFTRSATRRTRQLSGEVGRFGAVPAARLAGPAYPIWPSDHAGLVARLDRP
jgi:endonuclease/exonuclease/phosphatase family metal-dependent hydrolase